MTPAEIITELDENSAQMRELADKVKDAQVGMTKLAIRRSELDAEFRRLQNERG